MSMSSFRSFMGGKWAPSSDELQLFKRAQQYSNYLTWIPSIRMIAICNSLSMYNGDGESDIDLFIVADPGWIWLVRGLVTLVLQILGVRRHGNLVVGRFCLSFFATTQGMNLSTIAILWDIYLQEWGRSLKPIWSRADCYGEFLRVNSEFLGAISPEEDRENRRFLREDNGARTQELKGSWREFCNSFWRLADQSIRAIIRPHTLREYERLGKPWGVIISDDLLKFHPDDRRVELRDAFGARQ